MRTALYRFVGKLYHSIADYRYRSRIKMLLDGGLTLGKNVTISASAYIDDGYPYLIRIGDNCSLAEHVRVLAHDATTYKFTHHHTRLGKVDIKDNCFIGERSIILPGITIGPNALIAAGSLVNKDIAPNSCVAGVPARFYAAFDEFLERHEKQITTATVFDHTVLPVDADKPTRERVLNAFQTNSGFVYKKGRAGRDPFTWNVD